MADDVEDKDEEDWSEALAENSKNLETSKNTSKLEVSLSKISELPVDPTAQILQATSKVNTTHQDKVSLQPNPASEKVENHPKNPSTPNLQRPFKSVCHPRSRDVGQCQKHIQDIIGKHEVRNEELEQLEGNLRQRLQALESSMPAVMVWNIWRMAQSAPTSAVRRAMEKQFQGFGADNVPVPTTPSQHWDERVRRVEAERKEALRRAEEARALLAGKETAVHERIKRLEEAKKCYQERKEMMEKLARDAAERREALKNARGDDNTDKSNECGEICKEKWLDAVGSVSSIGSTDLECFAKLQELAEAEICMKRQITELERREEAYMRTLQQADEMWSKMEGDTADTVSLLQDQLDLKTTANQQLADRICQLEDELESLKKKLISCKEALSKFTSKVFTEVQSGHDDSEADVKDRGVLAAVKTTPASATVRPETFDQESSAYPEKKDKESHVVAPEKSHVGIIAVPKMSSKTSEALSVPVDQTHRGVDPVTELKTDAAHGGISPVSQTRIGTPVGDEENIPEHWKNWDWDVGCPPDIICDDMIESATGTDECKLDAGPKTVLKVEASSAMVDHPISRLESDQIAISLEELRNWYNIVDSVHHIIATGDDCSSKTDDVAQLAAKMKSHLRIKGVAGVKGPMRIPEKILKAKVIPSVEEMPQEMKSAIVIDGVDHPKQVKSYIAADEKEIDTERVPLSESTEKKQEEIKTAVPTDSIDLHDETEPRVPEVDAKIGKDISPLTQTTEEVEQETMHEGLMEHVDLPYESEPVISEEVAKVDEEIIPPTQSTDEIKTIDLIDHEDLVDETEFTISEEVAKTDNEISPLSAQREETKLSDVSVSLQKGGSPQTEEVELPAGRPKTSDISPVHKDVEIKRPKIVDEIPGAVTSQIDVSKQEPAVDHEKPPVSTEASSRVQEKAEDAIITYSEDVKVEDESAEIAPKETVKESEHELLESEKVDIESKEIRDSEKVEVESKEVREPSKIISPTQSVYMSAEEFSEHEFDASVITEPLPTIDLEELDRPQGQTLIGISEEIPEEAEETVPVPKDDELKPEAVELLERPGEFLPVEESPLSFVTLRTPPPSKIDVRKEKKDETLAITDLRGGQSTLDSVHEKRSSEVIVSEELEEVLSTIGDVPVKTKETMPELDIREPVSVEPEEHEKVSITKTIDYEQRPEIIDAEGIPELEVAISKAGVVVKADSETKPEIPKARSQPDATETERTEDKLDEDISTKGKIAVDRPKAGKPYLAIAKIESWKKLELPTPMGPCICKPRICPLLGRSAGRRPKLKVVEVVTSGTQTTPSIPKTFLGRMDKQKLPETTRPSPAVTMWRRTTISPRRPKDKSTLTTVCVDTQTDSTLVRGRIPLQGTTRKDECTCSGACPRKPDHGGCIQRFSNRPTSEKRPAPVSLATAKLFSSTNFPMSMTSCAEKEICVVRYTGRSFASSGSHLDCIECGRPITPGGTVLSTKSILPTTSTSQKSIMNTPKRMVSSTSLVTHSKDGRTCCDCKTSGNLTTHDSSESKRQNHKDLDKRKHDQDVCCPCPPKVAKKTSSKLSKKKRKPEMKDQAVMANISKNPSKTSSKGAKGIDVVKKKSPHGTSSKTKRSDTGTKTASKIVIPGKESYCSCDEFSHELTSSGVQSSADGAKTLKDDHCNCLLMESVTKGSSCNCFDYHV